MSRFAAAALVLLAGMTLGTHANAVEWKWRDANGRIIYSDRPPPANVPDKAILKRPKGLSGTSAVPPSPSGPSLVPGPEAVVKLPVAAASAAASGPKLVEPELEAKRRKDAEAKAAAAKADEARVAAAQAENCKRARGQLKLIEDGGRLSRTNDKGEREVLDDKARDEEMARARKAIAADCK